MSRRWWIVAVALMAAAVRSGGDPAAPPPPLRLRVLTYNIHGGAGMDGRKDLPRLAGVIRAAAPDLVALQEVDRGTKRSGQVDQAAELARLTGLHMAYAKALDLTGGAYGNALLSRWPLARLASVALPGGPRAETRSAALVEVVCGTNGPALTFAATHLENANAQVRLEQVDVLLKALAARGGGPAVLAGDLNAEPGSEPLRMLAAEGWTDATAGVGPSWRADAPTIKIDYVLFRPAGAWRVVEARVLDEPNASDHRPVLAVLEWRP